MGTTRAVVGFAFVGEGVLLIRKESPASQRGKLNGVGGKVEPGESVVAAMVREFKEETGIVTQEADWQEVAVMVSPRWEVTFFRATISAIDAERAVQAPPTREMLFVCNPATLLREQTTRNVPWLVSFCACIGPHELPLRFGEVL